MANVAVDGGTPSGIQQPRKVVDDDRLDVCHVVVDCPRLHAQMREPLEVLPVRPVISISLRGAG